MGAGNLYLCLHRQKLCGFCTGNRPSSRELQIIELLTRGYNSRDIGNILFLSEHTVKTQRKNLLKKYVASTYELVALAARLKWVKNE